MNFKNRIINIDTSNKCTLECPKCMRQDYKKLGRKVPGGDLSIKNFHKLIEYFRGVCFCGQISDPIFNRNLIEFLKICKQKNKWCSVHTAASHKKIEWYEEAFKANLNTEWIFGIDGLPYQSFIYRVNQDGEKVFEMAKLAKKLGVKKVVWQYIVFGYNEKYIDKAKKLAHDNDILFELNISARWNKNNSYDPYRPKQSKNKLRGMHDKVET